jgi:hypothetical protein
MARARGEADIFESGGYAAAALRGGESLDEERVLDVFGGGEDRDKVEGLKDEADLLAAENRGLRRAEAGGVCALDEDAAGGGLVNAADEVEEGGFSAATGARDGEKFATVNCEAEAVEGGDEAMVEGEAAGDLLDTDEGVRRIHRALSFRELGFWLTRRR